MKKAVISVFVVLAMVLNIFGFGVLQARSSAVGVVPVLLEVAKKLAIGFLIGEGAKTAIVGSGTMNSEMADYWCSQTVQAISDGNLITAEIDSNNTIQFSVSSSCPSDQQEFATLYAAELNNLDPTIRYVDPVTPPLQSMQARWYEAAKTQTVNAFTEYLELKRRQIEFNNYPDAMSELASALGHEWDPSYQFSFVGPLTPAQLSDVNSIHSIDFEGIHFYAPFKIGSVDNNGWFLDRSFLVSIGCPDNDSCIYLSAGQGSGYRGKTVSHSTYSGSVYIIYNDDIYFSNAPIVHQASKINVSIDAMSVSDYSLQYYYNLNGVSLYSAGVRQETVNGLYYGFYEWTNPGNRESRPILNSVPDEDDFIDTSSGGILDPGLTDEESAISSAIGLGIISDNPTLEFDNEGNLISADGISLATLESLVQELIDKTYSFESFEEYLQTITQLLQAGNLNTDQIDDILSALREWESSQADALDDINAAIGAAASSITSALEISASDAELDLPDLDADTFIVSHSGLAEAATITNSIPIVGQVSQLFNNLLDSSQYDNSTPDFRFYADLDNNGVSETYNAFDLSFLEYDLTNGNLADSDRFQNRLTIRQFLQYLIIFICYVAFAIRILKKLPSIFGADEGSNDFKSSEK